MALLATGLHLGLPTITIIHPTRRCTLHRQAPCPSIHLTAIAVDHEEVLSGGGDRIADRFFNQHTVTLWTVLKRMHLVITVYRVHIMKMTRQSTPLVVQITSMSQLTVNDWRMAYPRAHVSKTTVWALPVKHRKDRQSSPTPDPSSALRSRLPQSPAILLQSQKSPTNSMQTRESKMCPCKIENLPRAHPQNLPLFVLVTTLKPRPLVRAWRLECAR